MVLYDLMIYTDIEQMVAQNKFIFVRKKAVMRMYNVL